MLNSPLSLYKQKIADGYYHPDTAQEKAVQALQRLYTELVGELKAKKGRDWTGWASSLMKGISGQRDISPKGIYMYGGVGRGKSMLMDLFYHSLPSGIVKRRVHFHQFMIEVHDYFHERRSDMDTGEGTGFAEGVDTLIPSLASVIMARSRVLCFDEFHVTDVADAMILGRLFGTLMDLGAVIIATSNWPPDRLYEGGLQREHFLPFIAMLKERMEVVHLDSDIDYRAQVLSEEGNYFWPLNRNTKERVDNLFHKLTGGEFAHRDILQVKGRNLIIPKAVGGIARINFAAFCETPHGAEDYLMIARNYDTIFLEDVPKIGYDRRNEAKRFMTLIDAFYDEGVNLIVSADAPIEELYRGHDHGFEFERTVSRLKEMQLIKKSA